MVISIAAIVAGLVMLVWSADYFVDGAAAIARHLGVSGLIIGITIIGFGTSAPEMLVSVIAVLENTPNLAIGNALGSNIANIGLVLGVSALLAPVVIARELFRREFPLLLIATAVMSWCLLDFTLDRVDGLILVALLALMLWYLVSSHRQQEQSIPPQTAAIADDIDDEATEMSLAVALGWVIVGLIILVGSSKLLVWGATNVALALGVSELLIGLTIVAVGTSLPELAAAIASLKKNHADLVIGNVIGSNLFNSLAVIGIPAMITRFSIDDHAVTRDLPVVVGITLLLFVLARFPFALPRITRVKGMLLVAVFVIYQLYLYYGLITGNPSI